MLSVGSNSDGLQIPSSALHSRRPTGVHGPGVKIFDAPASLPLPAEYGRYLTSLLDALRRARRRNAQAVLEDFLGAAADAETLGVTGVHHVAAYAGDYEQETEFERWCEYLQLSSGLDDVRHGPSYIAPRLYGTPGHWINFTSGGEEYELFSCHARGDWATLSLEDKQSLMSHYALRVQASEQVLALLSFLSSRPGVEQIAYTPADRIGHTYGHLRRGCRVLEIVFSPGPGETETFDG
jgi:hypothetical protein